MTAAALMGRHYDQFPVGIEFSNEPGHQLRRNQWMIDGAEQQPRSLVGRQAANCGLNGGKLALLPILIHHDNFLIQL